MSATSREHLESDDGPDLREPRHTRVVTQDLFLAAQGVMNALALACLDDPAVPRELAEKVNDAQQWLTTCDWPILGWDTSEPPDDVADQLRRIEPFDQALMVLLEHGGFWPGPRSSG
jgi:hypothetical protein